MRDFITTELINGIVKVVHYIKYRNGKTVKRILDSNGNIEDIQDVTNG